jgi:Cu2+-exporting ATPase
LGTAIYRQHASKKLNTKIKNFNIMYACPMMCEGDKTYPQSGQCPVCNMNLVKIDNDITYEGHSHHDHQTHLPAQDQQPEPGAQDKYFCPMHPEIRSDKPGVLNAA